MMYKHHHARLVHSSSRFVYKNNILEHYRIYHATKNRITTPTYSNILQCVGFKLYILFPQFKKATKTNLLHNEIDIGYNR